MKVDWKSIAISTIDAVGGKDNIKEAFHCATRLRLILKDESLVDKTKLDQVDMAKGFNFSSGQLQIIFGTGTVNKVTAAVLLELKGQVIGDAKENSELLKPKLWNKNLDFKNNLINLLRTAVRSFADLFIPLIPVIIVGGLSLALSSAFTKAAKNSFGYDIKIIFEIMGGAILGSLPAFIGYTTAKKMGANPYLGMGIGLMLIAGKLLNAWSQTDEKINEFFKEDNRYLFQGILGGKLAGIGFFERIGYQAQAIPTIAIVAFFSVIYKKLDKIIPEFINLVFVPLVSCFIALFFGLWIIGPIMRIVATGIAAAFTWIKPGVTHSALSAFVVAIFALIYAPIVITGFHQGFIPIEADIVAKADGIPSTIITSVSAISNIAQGTAALLVFILIANKKLRQVGISGGLSAYSGITEPAMFGVNLRLMYPFVGAMLGSSIAGVWIGGTQTLATSMGSASWIGILVMQWSFTHSTAISGLSHGVSIIIGLLISTFSTAIIVFFLHQTKWAKKQIKEFPVDTKQFNFSFKKKK